MFAMYWPWAFVVLPFFVIFLMGEIWGALIVGALLYGIVFHLAPLVIANLTGLSESIPVLGPEHIFYAGVLLIASITIGFFYNRRKMLSENNVFMKELAQSEPDVAKDAEELNRRVRIFSEAQLHKTRIFFWPYFLAKDMFWGNLKWARRSIENDLRKTSRSAVEEFAKQQRARNNG